MYLYVLGLIASTFQLFSAPNNNVMLTSEYVLYAHTDRKKKKILNQFGSVEWAEHDVLFYSEYIWSIAHYKKQNRFLVY